MPTLNQHWKCVLYLPGHMTKQLTIPIIGYVMIQRHVTVWNKIPVYRLPDEAYVCVSSTSRFSIKRQRIELISSVIIWTHYSSIFHTNMNSSLNPLRFAMPRVLPAACYYLFLQLAVHPTLYAARRRSGHAQGCSLLITLTLSNQPPIRYPGTLPLQ